MIKVEEKSLKGYKFIDLFAGIGGFRIALESFGAQCVYSNEWDKYAQET
ncbi:MAG: DNA cytosine methyltransferase, partial [Eubacteriales bacterium]|nr:DNA cytosine methyltransferase [Eubacteriales bacterium]